MLTIMDLDLISLIRPMCSGTGWCASKRDWKVFGSRLFAENLSRLQIKRHCSENTCIGRYLNRAGKCNKSEYEQHSASMNGSNF